MVIKKRKKKKIEKKIVDYQNGDQNLITSS
jgi:hypothetical protein